MRRILDDVQERITIPEQRRREILEQGKLAGYSNLQQKLQEYQGIVQDCSSQTARSRFWERLSCALGISSPQKQLGRVEKEMRERAVNLEHIISTQKTEIRKIDSDITEKRELYNDCKCAYLGSEEALKESEQRIGQMRGEYLAMLQKLEQDPRNVALIKEMNVKESRIEEATDQYNEMEEEWELFSAKLIQTKQTLDVLHQLRDDIYTCKQQLEGAYEETVRNMTKLSPMTDRIANPEITINALAEAHDRNEQVNKAMHGIYGGMREITDSVDNVVHITRDKSIEKRKRKRRDNVIAEARRLIVDDATKGV